MLRWHRLTLIAALTLSACAESTAPEPTLAPVFAKQGGSTTTSTSDETLALQAKLAELAGSAGLMTCIPQTRMSVSQVVGSAGGVINIGKHQLVIPKGAVTANVTITAEAVADSFNSIRFGPEGLKFKKSAALTIDYSNCWIPALLSPVYVVFVDEVNHSNEKQPSVDFREYFRVTGAINHFSRYAVAW